MGFSIIWLSNHLTFERTWSRSLQKPTVLIKLDISVYFYYKWVDTSADRLLDPEGIIVPVVTVSALVWFITCRHIFFYWGLMSYLRYLCLFVFNGGQHILCFCFVFTK